GMRTLDVWYAQDDVDRARELLASSMDQEARRRTDRAAAKARTRTHLQAYTKLTRVTAEGRRIAPDPPLLVPLGDLLDDPAEELLASAVPRGPRRRAGRAAAAPRARAHLQADTELTGVTAEGRRIAPDPPLRVPLGDLLDDPAEERQGLRGVLQGYVRSLSSERRYLLGRYHVVDMARKVVGVGSVGTRCWIVLLLGRDDDDPLLLQAKEAQESVLAPYTGGEPCEHQG